MAKCMICLPNSAPLYVPIDCDSLFGTLGSRLSAFVHSCPPEDSCRNSVPCLWGVFFPCLVERYCRIDRRSFRLSISDSRNVIVSRYTRNCDSLKDSGDLTQATAFIPDKECFQGVEYDRPSESDELSTEYLLKDGVVIKVLFRLLGGKGGFGALLKGKGRRKKQSSNIDSCRTLSGERLRHVRLKELAQRQPETVVDSKATKLPRLKDDPDKDATKSQLDAQYKHVKTLRKESKRVKSTVARGLQKLEDHPSCQASPAEKDNKLERVMKECMDLYDL
ncbi:hypothetical protein X943_000263 [Babesia divergens]|uniref:SDE2-like domain-containing protein n=1 Tax=Babesia divergens TaxID=32595 RepID=A0AAD9GF38_BABDI|nr:hypothetical protein X943_000263 [Babesia divergens]